MRHQPKKVILIFMSNRFVLFLKICLVVFVAQHPRHYGFTHGHITDDCQRSNLIGLSPTAGFSGIRVRKYHYPQLLSWLSNDCYSLVQVLKDTFCPKTEVVRLCSSRSRAESVTYLLYRYSVVKYQWRILSSHLIATGNAKPHPLFTNFFVFFQKSFSNGF